MNIDINPKYIVYGSMVFSLIFIFMDGGAEGCKGGWSPFVPLAVVILGMFYLHDNFTPNSEIKQQKPVDLGYKERPMSDKYEEGKEEGAPTLKYHHPRHPGRGL